MLRWNAEVIILQQKMFSKLLAQEIFVNPDVRKEIPKYREKFLSAQPFKHVVIDNFLSPQMSEKVLEEFPSFNTKKAMNELGYVAGKAVNENLGSISPTYNKLASYLESFDFLRLVESITNIKGLITDYTFFGGGTHENLHEQELDPHVDFNYDERNGYHRRLNLIIYLNKEWQSEWGGCLDLHSNPRSPETDQVISFLPTFNRCAIFETNEYSWHGFRKIQLPEDKRHLSRKSLSIYLYSKDRPPEEIVAPHATFYISRWLPERIQPGIVLSEEDFNEIRVLMKRRDDMIEFYQNRELETNAYIQGLREEIKKLT